MNGFGIGMFLVAAWVSACATGEKLGEEFNQTGPGGPGAGGSGASGAGAGAGASQTGGAVGAGASASGGMATGGSSGEGSGGGTGGGVDGGGPPGDAMLVGADGAAQYDSGVPDPVPSCDGVDGLACPLGVSVGATVASSPSLGGGGGSTFSRLCDPDRVLTGLDIRYSTGSGGEIRQVRPECSLVSLVAGTTPGTFAVQTSDPVLGAITGNTTTGTLVSDRCGENQMVLGLVARVASSEVRRLGFYCGAASVAPSSSGDGWELQVGPVSYASPERGRDPGPTTTAYTCPSGTAGTLVGGRSGNRIDQIYLSCSPLAVPVVCPVGSGSEDCHAEVLSTPVDHRMLVTENATATLSCSSGLISEFTSTYGAGCAGTCPVACGQCTLGSESCSVTYDNAACGDCSGGCTKLGTLEIICE
jgi:hypothetical protein